jgi:hypothetical protein
LTLVLVSSVYWDRLHMLVIIYFRHVILFFKDRNILEQPGSEENH